MFHAAWATDVGRVREMNEDAVYVGAGLWAVADGMGGHAAGEVASALAIEALGRLDALPHRTPDDVLAALEVVNEQILDYGDEHRNAAGLGTTATGVALVEGAERPCCVFNVGDSRTYLFAGGRLRQLTTDHTEVQTLIDEGVLGEDEARHHPLRHYITRCLGMTGPFAGGDTWLLEPEPGDRFLICSDGLNGELSDSRIANLLTIADPQQAADALVAAALAAGGRDNVSVVVLDYRPDAVAASGPAIGDDAAPSAPPLPVDEDTVVLRRPEQAAAATPAGADPGTPTPA